MPDGAQRNTIEKRGKRSDMNFYQRYHSDSYLREMEAVVVRVEGNRIALDQTVFYAQSGGQPADHGTLSCTIPDLIRTKVNLLPEGIEVVRVCEIVGLDLQADGGTHVARTAEVGPIRVIGHESKGRINKRLRLAIER
jgi:Ser-tRNA(Ala) deacylase AlaX